MLISETTTYRPYEGLTNGAVTSSTPAVATQLTINGSGVQKRAGFKSLKGPQRSAPLSYWKQWDKAGCGNFSENSSHTRVWYFGQVDQDSTGQRGPNYRSSLNTDEYDPSVDDADYKAVGDLLEKLKGEGANIANMIGERKQTVKSVENVLNTIVYTVRDLRHGRISSAVRRMGGDPLSARKLRGKDIANQWLSLQYGWKPLLSDVYELVTESHRREKDRLMVFKGKGGHSREYRVPSEHFFNGSWRYPYNEAAKKLDTGVHLVKAKRTYMVRCSPDIVFAEPAALGVTNPLTVAWEVTPWSFVVDWFYPVGSYLEQLSAAHGWNFYDGCVSTLVKSNVAWQWNYSSKSSTEDEQHNVDSYSFDAASYADFSCVTFRRGTISGFPGARPPRLKNPVSTGHLLNGLALLSQMFKGR